MIKTRFMILVCKNIVENFSTSFDFPANFRESVKNSSEMKKERKTLLR